MSTSSAVTRHPCGNSSSPSAPPQIAPVPTMNDLVGSLRLGKKRQERKLEPRKPATVAATQNTATATSEKRRPGTTRSSIMHDGSNNNSAAARSINNQGAVGDGSFLTGLNLVPFKPRDSIYSSSSRRTAASSARHSNSSQRFSGSWSEHIPATLSRTHAPRDIYSRSASRTWSEGGISKNKSQRSNNSTTNTGSSDFEQSNSLLTFSRRDQSLILLTLQGEEGSPLEFCRKDRKKEKFDHPLQEGSGHGAGHEGNNDKRERRGTVTEQMLVAPASTSTASHDLIAAEQSNDVMEWTLQAGGDPSENSPEQNSNTEQQQYSLALLLAQKALFREVEEARCRILEEVEHSFLVLDEQIHREVILWQNIEKGHQEWLRYWEKTIVSGIIGDLVSEETTERTALIDLPLELLTEEEFLRSGIVAEETVAATKLFLRAELLWRTSIIQNHSSRLRKTKREAALEQLRISSTSTIQQAWRLASSRSQVSSKRQMVINHVDERVAFEQNEYALPPQPEPRGHDSEPEEEVREIVSDRDVLLIQSLFRSRHATVSIEKQREVAKQIEQRRITARKEAEKRNAVLGRAAGMSQRVYRRNAAIHVLDAKLVALMKERSDRAEARAAEVESRQPEQEASILAIQSFKRAVEARKDVRSQLLAREQRLIQEVVSAEQQQEKSEKLEEQESNQISEPGNAQEPHCTATVPGGYLGGNDNSSDAQSLERRQLVEIGCQTTIPDQSIIGSEEEGDSKEFVSHHIRHYKAAELPSREPENGDDDPQAGGCRSSSVPLQWCGKPAIAEAVKEIEDAANSSSSSEDDDEVDDEASTANSPGEGRSKKNKKRKLKTGGSHDYSYQHYIAALFRLRDRVLNDIKDEETVNRRVLEEELLAEQEAWLKEVRGQFTKTMPKSSTTATFLIGAYLQMEISPVDDSISIRLV